MDRWIGRVQAYLWIAVAAAIAYSAWVFASRIAEHNRLKQRTQIGANPEFERAYGGDAVKILQFYARDGIIERGGSTVLCYGVLNARAVHMEPALPDLYPAMNRCIEVSPAHTTTYRLTADGAKETHASGSLTIVVK